MACKGPSHQSMVNTARSTFDTLVYRNKNDHSTEAATRIAQSNVPKSVPCLEQRSRGPYKNVLERCELLRKDAHVHRFNANYVWCTPCGGQRICQDTRNGAASAANWRKHCKTKKHLQNPKQLAAVTTLTNMKYRRFVTECNIILSNFSLHTI